METRKRISRIRLMTLGEKHGRIAKEMGLKMGLISPSSCLKASRACRADFVTAGKKFEGGFSEKMEREE